MNPWEETWDAASTQLRKGPGAFDAIASFDRGHDPIDAEDLARAKLAAQAPAMARVLLAYFGKDCEMCGHNNEHPHHPSCALATVLRAAGVVR